MIKIARFTLFPVTFKNCAFLGCDCNNQISTFHNLHVGTLLCDAWNAGGVCGAHGARGERHLLPGLLLQVPGWRPGRSRSPTFWPNESKWIEMNRNESNSNIRNWSTGMTRQDIFCIARTLQHLLKRSYTVVSVGTSLASHMGMFVVSYKAYALQKL